jgi:hypothetical protein
MPCSTAATASAPGVSTPLFHDKNTQHIGKSQSTRPHKNVETPRSPISSSPPAEPSIASQTSWMSSSVDLVLVICRNSWRCAKAAPRSQIGTAQSIKPAISSQPASTTIDVH